MSKIILLAIFALFLASVSSEYHGFDSLTVDHDKEKLVYPYYGFPYYYGGYISEIEDRQYGTVCGGYNNQLNCNRYCRNQYGYGMCGVCYNRRCICSRC